MNKELNPREISKMAKKGCTLGDVAKYYGVDTQKVKKFLNMFGRNNQVLNTWICLEINEKCEIEKLQATIDELNKKISEAEKKMDEISKAKADSEREYEELEKQMLEYLEMYKENSSNLLEKIAELNKENDEMIALHTQYQDEARKSTLELHKIKPIEITIKSDGNIVAEEEYDSNKIINTILRDSKFSEHMENKIMQMSNDVRFEELKIIILKRLAKVFTLEFFLKELNYKYVLTFEDESLEKIYAKCR